MILRPVDDTEALLAAVTDWGRERSDVRAVLVVGSQARTDTPADQWSDVDLVLVVDDPTPNLASAEWLGAFGRPLLSVVEPTAVGPFTERRVLLETGLEVDFALLPVAAARRMAEDPEGMAVLRSGFGVLVDTLGLEAHLQASATRPWPPELPDQAAFAQLTHDFWYHLLWAAKKLRRGELWIATQTCNCHLKGLLVTLLGLAHQGGRAPGRHLARRPVPGALGRSPHLAGAWPCLCRLRRRRGGPGPGGDRRAVRAAGTRVCRAAGPRDTRPPPADLALAG